MSLYGEWRNKASPLRQFFDTRMPETAALRADWSPLFAGRESWWPYPPGVKPPFGVLGKAIDTRIRIRLGSDPHENVGWKGVLWLAIDTGIPLPRFAEIGGEVVVDDLPIDDPAWQQRRGAAPIVLQGAEEAWERFADPAGNDRLAADCLFLGWYEEFARAGLAINSPLFRLDETSTVEDLDYLIDRGWVADVDHVAELFEPTFDEWSAYKIIFGPSFVGSRAIGGADGDLIVGDTLVEIKSSKSPTLRRETMCQLAAYALLDYDDEYRIRNVGVYMARYGTTVSWPVNEYLSKLTGDAAATLEDERRRFEAVIGRDDEASFVF